MEGRKSNLLIIINCSLACMFLLIAGSLAAYTSLSNAKRTISTVGSKQLFSSNILLEYDEESAVQGKSMSFSADGNAVFKVSVCNYAQGDDGKYASENITYKINVSLLDKNGKTVTDQQILSAYKWNETLFSELTKPIEGTLTGGEASNKVYSVTVPAADMKKYKIKITADPTNTQYKALGRILYFSEDIASSEWKITYLSDEQNQKAYDLGCIHIKLTGSEYANLTLTWDTKHVQIDPWFLEDIIKDKNASATVGEDNNSLTFTAGGDTGKNQYNIAFYRTSPVHGDDSKGETWDDIKSYISLLSEKLTESKMKTTE